MKPRCFGKLYLESAKECLICRSRELCSQCDRSSRIIRQSKIRSQLIELMQERPRTINELQQALMSSRPVSGTSIYYHLSILKSKGQVVTSVDKDGNRLYSVFQESQNNGRSYSTS